MILTTVGFSVKRKKMSTFNWKKVNFDELKARVKNTDWENILEHKDANDSWDCFSNMYPVSNYEELVPRMTNRSSRRPPWMKKKIIQEIQRSS